MEELLKRFPFRCHGDHNICLTHRFRKRFNAFLNQGEKLPGREHVICQATKDPLSQEMALRVGTPLMCIRTDSAKNLHNGQAALVVSVNPLQIKTLTSHNPDSELEGEAHTYSKETVGHTFRLCFARTYQTVQAATFEGTVVLYQVTHPRFTPRHLLVGMSRATDLESLSLFP